MNRQVLLEFTAEELQGIIEALEAANDETLVDLIKRFKDALSVFYK
jgi:hypothetical protein